MSTIPECKPAHQHPDERPCPRWCPRAGHHAADFPDGARVHTLLVGNWASVSQVDAPEGRSPAAVVVNDLDLSPADALQLRLDLSTAAAIAQGLL